MSELKTRLATEFKAAMLAKDLEKKEIVQLVRAGVLQIEKDKQIEADDALVMSVIQKEVKIRLELLKEIGQERPLAEAKILREIELLKAYLPEPLTEEALETIVRQEAEALGATSMKDMGTLMKAVQAKVQGQADNSQISRLVRAVLA